MPFLPRRSSPKPSDWGFGVTTCVAVICNGGKTVVTVTDLKVDFGNFSADRVATKNIPLGNNNTVLYAGNDVDHAENVINRTWALIDKVNTAKKRLTPELIADLLDAAYADELRREIEAKVLRKRGFDAKTFEDRGKQKCTPSAYLSLCNRIDQVSLSLEFLFCGFNSDGEAQLYKVDGNSAPKNYRPIGMWAIGSGAHAAMSWLAFHANRGNFRRYDSVEQAVYFALTAKFMAEASGEAGSETFTIILEHEKPPRWVGPTEAQEIKKLWNKFGIPRTPKDLKTKIAGKIRSSGK